MRSFTTGLVIAAGLGGCRDSAPSESTVRTQFVCEPARPLFVGKESASKLSGPIELEVEIRMTPGRPEADLGKYFQGLGFVVEVENLPGSPPLVAVRARKIGEFSVDSMNSIFTGAAKLSACSRGSQYSFKPVGTAANNSSKPTPLRGAA